MFFFSPIIPSWCLVSPRLSLFQSNSCLFFPLSSQTWYFFHPHLDWCHLVCTFIRSFFCDFAMPGNSDPNYFQLLNGLVFLFLSYAICQVCMSVYVHWVIHHSPQKAQKQKCWSWRIFFFLQRVSLLLCNSRDPTKHKVICPDWHKVICPDDSSTSPTEVQVNYWSKLISIQ